jgi:site-specific recombinase XerD
VLYENGEDSRTIGDLLGHADQSVTDRTCIHTVQRVQGAAAARLPGAIASARGGGA